MKNNARFAVFLILFAAATASAQKAPKTDAIPAETVPARTAPADTTPAASFSHAEALSGYSPWSFFGGLNLIINSNGAGVTFVGINPDGSTGGLSSAPSPIAGFLGAEYRYPIRQDVLIAPSLSLYGMRYLWAEDRALPAEIENRTAFVPTLLLDCPFLYRIESGRLLYTFGGGPGVLLRWGFLESGVGKNEKSYSEDMAAGDQVKEINKYLWGSGRWFYPITEGNVRYRLDNGWGAGAHRPHRYSHFQPVVKPASPVLRLDDDHGSPRHHSAGKKKWRTPMRNPPIRECSLLSGINRTNNYNSTDRDATLSVMYAINASNFIVSCLPSR